MFKLDKNSVVVKAWITMVMSGAYSLEDVPKIFGIYDAVKGVLVEMGIVAE